MCPPYITCKMCIYTVLAHSMCPCCASACAHRCSEAKRPTQSSRHAWPWGGGTQLRPPLTHSPLVELWYCHYVLGPPLGSEARLYGRCTAHTPMMGKCWVIKPAPLSYGGSWQMLGVSLHVAAAGAAHGHFVHGVHAGMQRQASIVQPPQMFRLRCGCVRCGTPRDFNRIKALAVQSPEFFDPHPPCARCTI